MLDTVIRLKRPSDYTSDRGAEFEVHFEKSRGITGEDVRPFVARLETPNGEPFWSTQTLEESTYDKVVSLTNDGFTQKDIAEELGVHKSRVSRHLKKARETGIIFKKVSTE